MALVTPKKRNSSEGEMYETKLLRLVQVPTPFFFMKYENEGGRTKTHALDIFWKIGQNHGYWALAASFQIWKKKNTNSNLTKCNNLFYTFPL